MKKILSFVLMMCVLMTIPMFAFAAVSGDEPLTIGTPFMITNAGQGPGGKMGATAGQPRRHADGG